MPNSKNRFPRAAYARRAALLAEDLNEWVPGLLEYARGRDNWLHTDAEIARREDRAAAIQDLVIQLQEIAIDIEGIR